MQAGIISVDVSNVAKKVARLKKDSALGSFLASEAAAGMDQYVPFRDGPLSASAHPKPFEVEYEVPYAKYQYNGVSKGGGALKHSTQGHPNATKEWDRAYVLAGGAEKLAEAATQYIKGH